MPSVPSSPRRAITLDHEDQEAMPEALRTALLAWHAQHRALQAGVSWQQAQAVPAQVTHGQLMRTALQAVHGLVDPDHLRSWLDGFYADTARKPDPRLGLVAMLVEARRTDLLDVVLNHPGWRSRTTSPGSGRSPHGATVPFNGALRYARRRATNAAGPGLLFLDHLHEHWPELQHERNPLIQAFPFLGRDRQMAEMEVEQAQHQQVDRIRAAGGAPATHRVSLVPGPAMRAVLKKATGARMAYHLNVVGLAVLHGWPEGMRRLLDAGVDPYTPASPKWTSHSALMLACVFGETACARALIEHSSFSASARYGRSARELAGQAHAPSDTELWRLVDPSLRGGYEWNVVCRSTLIGDPDVREAMMARWQRMPRSVQARLKQDDPVAAHRWEQEILRAEILEVPVIAAPHARPRL